MKSIQIRNGHIIVAVIALLALFILVTGSWGWYLAQPGPLKQESYVVIKSGSSVGGIARVLKKSQVIENEKLFRIAVWLMRLQTSLQAGEYQFGPAISLRTIVNKIATGDTIKREITLPEGLTVLEMMEKIEKLPFDVKNDDLAEIPEGTLYPDTYDYQYGGSLSQFIQRLQKRMEKELQSAWSLRISNLPLASPNELLILASIVEKETSVPSERARIAGVFINRLNKGMKLQSDPTVIYGASDYAGDLKAVHLKENHPYNTYVHKGLPPTPIANPGREALIATAQPENHDYFYFVASGEGGHVFSKTYQEHLQNVARYLKIYRQKHGRK
ncbi:MAG: endolytic transglycosylase MltG [Alphaproteobacteria bacterium]|nr:endolytic transglycosylase MltG [Alphaproteobacteria bacterium]MDD9919098.1 endolytic transglycosylase MltG [Alphaproteobacteria bacterium]